MAQERTLEEVVSPFLMQLEKARAVPLVPDEDSSYSDVTFLFENIKKEACEVKNILQRVSKWEK